MDNDKTVRRRAPSRKELFNLCKTRELHDRNSYGLEGVEYGDKMTTGQVKGMVRYLQEKKGIVDMRSLLTHEAMSAAARVMCRWPRPSELARAIQMIDEQQSAQDAYYFVNTVRVREREEDGSGMGRFIGKHGMNLYRLTKKADLLYIWVKPMPGKADEHTIYLYASDGGEEKAGAQKMDNAKGIIEEAVRKSRHVELVKSHAGKTRGISFSEKSKDWEK